MQATGVVGFMPSRPANSLFHKCSNPLVGEPPGKEVVIDGKGTTYKAWTFN